MTGNKINHIFICGALRSGSTLFHLMLNSHPNIKNPGEFDFLFDQVSNDGGFPKASDYIKYLSSDRIFNSKSLAINDSLDYLGLVRSFVNQLSEDNKVLAINIHRNFEHAYKIFPEAKFIHLLRDPRDVARSSIGMNWAGNVYYGVDHWLDTERSWDRLVTCLGNNQSVEVRFEKLISEPVNTLEYVCDFLDVTYTDEMFNYEKNSTYSKPDITLINQWKKKLNCNELKCVEYKVKEMMLSRKYGLSGVEIRAPNYLERSNLFLQNKLFRLYKGIKVYGFPLYAAYKMTDKLNLNSWHVLMKKKKSDIDRKHLK